jgi:hypothetical protein
MHPATANNANVPTGGDMATTVDGSDSFDYGKGTILSSPLLPLPTAAEAPSLSLNLLDRKISASNTMVDWEIIRVVKHAAKTTGSVETIIDTATNADGTTTNPLPPDSVTLQKLNDVSTNEKCLSDTNAYPMRTK